MTCPTEDLSPSQTVNTTEADTDSRNLLPSYQEVMQNKIKYPVIRGVEQHSVTDSYHNNEPV